MFGSFGSSPIPPKPERPKKGLLAGGQDFTLGDALYLWGASLRNVANPNSGAVEQAGELFAQQRENARAEQQRQAQLKAQREYGQALAAGIGMTRPRLSQTAPSASDVPAVSVPQPTTQRPRISAVPSDMDAVVRTVWGEARNQGAEGQQGVAAVIENRARQAGMSARDVVMAPKQFSPWGDANVRARMEALDPTSPEYQAILQNVRPVLEGDLDPTGGADHFYNPTLANPSWGRGDGQMIGDHKFLRLGYSGAGAPRSALSADDASRDVVDQGFAPEAYTQPSEPYRDPRGPTDGEVAMIQAGLASDDPAIYARAVQQMERIQQRMVAPEDYEVTVTDQGQIIRTSKYGGVPMVEDIPGYRIKPEAGFRTTSDGRQTFIEGGSKDPTSAMNRLQGVKEFRGELKPILDKAEVLTRNIEAVRSGYRQQNGSGDIAMVNGLQKLIDDGVVREGDVALQLQANGIDGRLAGLAGFLTSNGKFDAELRGKIQRTAEDLYGSLNRGYRDRALAYKGSVERAYGPGAFEDVLPAQTARIYGWDLPDRPKGTEKATDAQWRAAQQFRGSRAQPGTRGNPFIPDTRAEFDNLPVGAWYVASDGSVGQKRPRKSDATAKAPAKADAKAPSLADIEAEILRRRGAR